MTSGSTGDCTWGWLSSTEDLGREAEPDEFVRLAEEKIHETKYKSLTNAAHCMIYAENGEKVFGIYKIRASVLIQLRYDGYFGFPGGLVDRGEDSIAAVNRELAEEMHFDTTVHRITNDDYVVSHWSEKKQLVLHFYKLKVTVDELVEIEKRALLANDYGKEVLGTVRVPLYTMGDRYRGFPLFLKHKFIGCSRQQLLATLLKLNIFTAEEIQSALNANNGDT